MEKMRDVRSYFIPRYRADNRAHTAAGKHAAAQDTFYGFFSDLCFRTFNGGFFFSLPVKWKKRGF